MADTISTPRQAVADPLIKWTPVIFYKPRRVFENLTSATRRYWMLPMLVLTITMLGTVLVSGWLKQQNAFIGEDQLPTDFQYYSPEQQAQYMQAMQVTQGPVFVYVLPALASTLGLWVSWLIIGGVLHLTTTLLGGRGDMSTSLNIAAWSSMPFALRDIIRIIAMLVTRRLIGSPGLAGFAPAAESGWGVFVAQLLSMLDIYTIWAAFLLILGVRLTTNLTPGKAALSGLISILTVLFLRALIGLAAAQLGGLNVIRPFFF
jgi:hypothetical protein